MDGIIGPVRQLIPVVVPGGGTCPDDFFPSLPVMDRPCRYFLNLCFRCCPGVSRTMMIPCSHFSTRSRRATHN